MRWAGLKDREGRPFFWLLYDGTERAQVERLSDEQRTLSIVEVLLYEDLLERLEALSAIPEEHRGTVFAPEIERVRGELLLSRRQRDEAERCFRQAIAIARDRSERSHEFRAATSLSRLLERQGKREDARRTLVEISGWFTEGFDTADLKAAKALLDELA